MLGNQPLVFHSAAIEAVLSRASTFTYSLFARIWMDPLKWHGGPSDWPTYTYQLLAPRVSVKGRMALILFLVVVWAFGWLIVRAYSVIKTPNEVLVDKLGLDIPPAPSILLEEISSREIQISWKHVDPQNSVQSYLIELNGKIIGQTKKTEATATLHNLLPGTLYDVRVFTVSATRFQTPSPILHLRTSPSSQVPSSEDSNDGTPYIRASISKSPSLPTPPTAPAMAREQSGGQPAGRRGTTGRRVSPAHLAYEVNEASAEDGNRAADDELEGDLAQLSERFQKAQQDQEAVEGQILEEDKEYEALFADLERRRDELKDNLKERDEKSSNLKKEIHKLETANRTAQSEKSKKERLLQQKEGQRRKRREEVARWDDQISSMKDEMAGIETQKAAIEKRTQSDINEIQRKIEEEQKELASLEEENKEKALQIKALEEERTLLNADDETDESREADRLEHEREARWQDKLRNLSQTYSNLWNHVNFAREHYAVAQERLAFLKHTRQAAAVSFASMPPLDMDAVRRGQKPIRRNRHGSSLASSVSSPRAIFPPEHYISNATYASGTTASPTTVAPFFNMANGTTMRVPEESTTVAADDLDTPEGVPMSPRAEVLLPADLLGDESADELDDEDVKPTKNVLSHPFPSIKPSSLLEEEKEPESPSPISSSSRSFSSPRESFFDTDRGSINSAQQSADMSLPGDAQPNSRKLMSNLFSFNRQRGKTLANEPPLLGSLKSGQSHSFPRKYDDDLDPMSRRRRSSYAGRWEAFPGNLLTRPSGSEKDPRISASRRAFPNLFSIGKSSSTAPGYDPFTARTDSFDADIRIDNSSPRPSSTYSFDKLPRPSLESQFRAWGPERAAIRGSPLAPDWASTHSFSRSQSRRPSIHQGSASNLSLVAQGDEDFLDPSREPKRPLQAPIGTRPPSSQRPATPKLNPTAPAFTLFTKKSKTKDKSTEIEDSSPPDSRKSKDTPSIAATASTFESRESLERSSSAHSGVTSMDATPAKPTFISKITRKASSNKFGSWKEKGSLFSRKEPSTPNTELEEDTAAATTSDQLGKSLESTSTTPSGEDKKASRTSLTWSFMKRGKKGFREDLGASEVSESSERASEVGDPDEDGEREG